MQRNDISFVCFNTVKCVDTVTFMKCSKWGMLSAFSKKQTFSSTESNANSSVTVQRSSNSSMSLLLSPSSPLCLARTTWNHVLVDAGLQDRHLMQSCLVNMPHGQNFRGPFCPSRILPLYYRNSHSGS